MLDEPSVVAINRDQNKVICVGEEAKPMLGRSPKGVEVIRPLKDGQIADFEAAKHMLAYFIHKVHETKFLYPSPRVLICVPSNSTPVEQRTIRESATEAGARQVNLIEEPMAAAIGAGLPIREPLGSMVVDIGGGTTEVGIVSLGGIVHSISLRVGGDSFDENIQSFIRQRHGALIGISTAERIKQEIGAAIPLEEVLELHAKGRDLASGIPKSIAVNSNQILDSLEMPLQEVVNAIKKTLESCPPELAADIAESGMVLTGGGALLRYLETFISDKTGLPVVVAEDPLTCVARGCGIALESEFDALFLSE